VCVENLRASGIALVGDGLGIASKKRENGIGTVWKGICLIDGSRDPRREEHGCNDLHDNMNKVAARAWRTWNMLLMNVHRI